ncbi:MAG: Type 1 glutamine amidotransferase-like domain-containing protein [Candidatus Dormibacteria bacterium]
MAAAGPTILATSGGGRPGTRTQLEFGPLIHYGLELAGVNARTPRICFVNTASGDQAFWAALEHEAGRAVGIAVSHLNLFPMPNVADMKGFLREADLVWVGGGSTANLLSLWRLHGLDQIFGDLWREGVVLSGVSAGSVCWHAGGTTDSFGPELRPVTDGLGLLPYSNGVHYDSEAQRRPLLQRLIAAGELPDGYATDNGVGLLYRGTQMVEAVTEVSGQGAYRVLREGDSAREERIEPRALPGAG